MQVGHLSLDKQRSAGHLLGLVETHDGEDSRGDVAEDTVGLLEGVAFGGVGHDEGNLVEGVGGLGTLLLVEHLLGVADGVLVRCAYKFEMNVDAYPWSEVMNRV